MDSLKGLFGGAADDDDQEILPGEKKGQAKDFISRYTTGDPTEGYSDEEARDRFSKVLQNASPETIQRAARQTIDNLPEDKRADFARMLQQRQAGQGMVDIQRTGETGAAQSDSRGGGTPDLGGLLGGLLGGGGGGGAGGMGGLDDLLGGLMGGGRSSGRSGATEGGGMGDMFGGLGGMLGSPVGKAIMGGIAAYAMKEMIDRR